MSQKNILDQGFYFSDDVLQISKDLLGKVLVTRQGGIVTAGMIVETEAYMGPEDKASHAYNDRPSKRTQTMYLDGGCAYVYLCYGIHHLFNVVTAPSGIPHAVLIRALQPLEGESKMLKRRQFNKITPKLTSGPGKLSQALAITTKLDAMALDSSKIWIEDRGMEVSNSCIVAKPRVGIDYAEEYKDKPWRFYIKGNPYISQK